MADSSITGLILAGGLGSRMGGVDKGLEPLRGRPLALHVYQRLQPQVSEVLINANRHLEIYRGWGAEVYADTSPDFVGPLAGFAVGMAKARTPYVLVVPCDTPLLPVDLARRLYQRLSDTGTDLSMAYAPVHDAQGICRLEAQPTCCLLKVGLLPNLLAFLAQGGRKVRAWTDGLSVSTEVFNLSHDDPKAFINLNTLAELQALERSGAVDD